MTIGMAQSDVEMKNTASGKTDSEKVPRSKAVSGSFFERFHESFVSANERRALRFIATRLPQWVTPDMMTLLGLIGGFVVFAGYVASHQSVHWIWLANFGLLIHWLGDSLDGTLARIRRIERPKYGYFVDQSVDLLTNLLVALGIGLSPFARLDFALLALTGYHMISVYVFIRNLIAKQFHVALYGLGPTEMRIGILALNIGITAFGVTAWSTPLGHMTWCDILVLLCFAIEIVIFLFAAYAFAFQLSVLEPDAKGRTLRDRIGKRRFLIPEEVEKRRRAIALRRIKAKN